MRIVVDTNVVMSAIIKADSVPASVIDLIANKHTFLTSFDTQCEIQKVIARPRFRRYLTADALKLIATIVTESEVIAIATPVIACRDPADDKFLELAVNGKADLIISGDQDLLAMLIYRGIPIITPAKFLALT